MTATSTSDRPLRILVTCTFFEPAFAYGGPVASVLQSCRWLGYGKSQ